MYDVRMCVTVAHIVTVRTSLYGDLCVKALVSP